MVSINNSPLSNIGNKRIVYTIAAEWVRWWVHQITNPTPVHDFWQDQVWKITLPNWDIFTEEHREKLISTIQEITHWDNRIFSLPFKKVFKTYFEITFIKFWVKTGFNNWLDTESIEWQKTPRALLIEGNIDDFSKCYSDFIKRT